MSAHLTPIELGEILVKIRTSYPSEAEDLRKHIESIMVDTTQDILELIVKPQVAKIVDVVNDHNDIELQRMELERRRLELYDERTKLLRDSILPKVMPVLVPLSLGVAWLFVAALASLLEIDLNDVWAKIPSISIEGGTDGGKPL